VVRLPDPQRSRAVLIGTGKYTDKKLPDLPVVDRTVGDVAAALTDPVHGVVTKDNCTVLKDQGDIRLIGRYLRSAAIHAEDLLLVYFVGHGLVSGRRRELYLGLSDSEWAEPEFNSLEYDKLRSSVLDSAATTKIIILDCCFSGRAVSEAMADPVTEMVGQIEVEGTYVLASAARDQVALILPGEDHTAFTGRFLDVLRNGVPGGPEFLTVDYLYRQLVTRMRAESLPQPQKRATSTADLLALAANRAFAPARISTAAPPAADPLAGPRLALVVATGTYTDPGLSQLRAPARDADDLAQVLADPDLGGFAVTTVIDQPAQQIRLAVEDFLADRSPRDLLLVYLSCHGLQDDRGRLYFAAADTRRDRLGSTGVEAGWILDLLERCRARRQVLILDSSFSGAFARGAAADGRGRVVLTASAATEYSFEGDPTDVATPAGSVFTTTLVRGLRTGAADIDRDGYVSVDDAYAYVFDHVQAVRATQTPQRWMYGAEGKILLARSPVGSTVIPAP
jgi:uncharacterized caspase-like protein